VNIKTITIKGFRGVKEQLTLTLDSKSILLFGDNGSGKSSITDAIEWFYYDKVEHLSSEEIGRSGIPALRNIHLSDREESYVEIEYDDSRFNNSKKLLINKGRLEEKFSNNSVDFNKYLKTSEKERLILRYSDLTKFVLSTKADRLKYFSEIIGFDDVTKTKEILKRGINHIKQKLQSKNYENEISRRESQIMEKLNERITSEDRFIEKINELIRPLGYEEIQRFDEVPKLLDKLKQIDDSIVIEKRAYYEDVNNKVNDLKNRFESIIEYYRDYYNKFNNLLNKVEDLKQILLSELWQRGLNILKQGFFKEDKCPLCFQQKSQKELIIEIKQRLSEIESLQSQIKELEDKKGNIQEIIGKVESIITVIKNKYFEEHKNLPIGNFVNYVEKYIEQINPELNKDITKDKELKCPEEFILKEEVFSELIAFCNEQYEKLGEKIKGKQILEVQDKILSSYNAFKEILDLKKEKEILSKLKTSLENIYNALVDKQKKELELFIESFSQKINEYYSSLHPNEKVNNIKIKTIEEDKELKGLTIEYGFYNISATPPHKYLSESHVNSLGLVLFLCSVEAFNKENKFFILDDVISSFDTNHRMRLSQLLIDKFNDYQIILLTHERNWFDLTKIMFKERSNWSVNIVKWTEEKGTCLDEKPSDFKNTNTI
jgi:recombinational DNA repair ATPase RecF